MAFLENTYFPDRLAIWARGGSGYSTEVGTLRSGGEYRQANISSGLARLMITDDRISVNDAAEIVELFDAAKGQYNGFRVKWRFNQQASGAEGTLIQLTSTTWQMYKTGALGSSKKIIKPRPTTISVAGGGTYSVNTANGVITKSGGADPTGWAGYFDLPVRFDTDLPDFGFDADGAFFSVGGLGLIELAEA